MHHHFDEIDDQLIVDLRANAEIAIEILALLLSRKEAGAISSEIGVSLVKNSPLTDSRLHACMYYTLCDYFVFVEQDLFYCSQYLLQ